MSTLIVNDIKALSNNGQVNNLTLDASANVTVGGYLSVGATQIAGTSATFAGGVSGITVTATEPTNAPFVVSSTTKVTNLNVDQVDGYHVGTSASQIPYLGGSGLSVNLVNKSIPTSDIVDVDSTQTLTNKSFGNDVTIDGNLTVAASTGSATITCDGDIIAFHTSDIRLKKNVERISKEPLSDLAKLQGIRFQWNADSKTDVGVIAQEIQKVIPEAVSERRDGTLAVRYELIIPLLIEAVNNLNNLCYQMKAEIEELKNNPA